MRLTLLMIIGLFLLNVCANADEIMLKNGKSVSGQIIEETDSYIKMQANFGYPMTYYRDEIESVAVSPKQVKEESKEVKQSQPQEETKVASSSEANGNQQGQNYQQWQDQMNRQNSARELGNTMGEVVGRFSTKK